MASTFTYDSYQITKNQLKFQYTFQDKKSFSFNHTIEFFDTQFDPSDQNIQRLVFFLGFSIIPYYYSIHFADQLIIKAARAEESCLAFFTEVFQKGLAELRYRNNLDVTTPINISYQSDHLLPATQPRQLSNKFLISNGGGKDSLISGELINSTGADASWFILGYNSKRISTIVPNVKASPYHNMVIANQLHDPYTVANEFVKTHGVGYIGHKPFNVYLSFLGLLAAYNTDHNYFVVSNESSANVSNLIVDGFPVNHQYSKSLAYEELFQKFIHSHLNTGVGYFSAIRPFSDEQIGQYFTKFSKYFKTFISCNYGISTGTWCNNCPKCAYIFLLIYASINLKTAVDIFGANLLKQDDLHSVFLELLGLNGHRPFECVGEIEEVRKLYLKVYKDEKDTTLGLKFNQFLASQTVEYQTSLQSFSPSFAKHLIPNDLWQKIQQKLSFTF